jgi:hypothetical protein
LHILKRDDFFGRIADSSAMHGAEANHSWVGGFALGRWAGRSFEVKAMKRYSTLSFVFAWVVAGSCLTSSADEVLVNGSLDMGASPPGWMVSSFFSDEPGTQVSNIYEHNDGANNPAVQGLGIVLHPQIGNQGAFAGQDRMTNFIMEQTYSNVASVVAGRTFTFKGDVALQEGYSGVVETLNDLFPRADYNSNFVVDAADYTVWRDNLDQLIALPNEGPTPGIVDSEDYTEWKNRFGQMGHPAGPSPTVTKFEMEFFDAGNNQLGDTLTWDLRDGEGLNDYRTGIDQVAGVAPAGATQVKVRVSALDMLDNCCTGGQDVRFDNFSLTDGNEVNRLQNANLNTPGAPVGWTLFEGPTVDQGMGPITADSASFINFANRKIEDTTPPIDPVGVSTNPSGQGLWLRPFVNETGFEPDIPGVDAIVSQVVAGTPGAEYSFSAWSAWEFGYGGGFPGTSTETFIKIEFLDAAMGVLATHTTDLLDAGQMNDDEGGLEWDDWRQFFVNGTAPAGTAQVRVSAGATGMFHSGINPQSGFFDEFSLIETLPGAGALAVPEPAGAALVAIALGLLCVGRRRGGS